MNTMRDNHERRLLLSPYGWAMGQVHKHRERARTMGGRARLVLAIGAVLIGFRLAGQLALLMGWLSEPDPFVGVGAAGTLMIIGANAVGLIEVRRPRRAAWKSSGRLLARSFAAIGSGTVLVTITEGLSIAGHLLGQDGRPVVGLVYGITSVIVGLVLTGRILARLDR